MGHLGEVGSESGFQPVPTSNPLNGGLAGPTTALPRLLRNSRDVPEKQGLAIPATRASWSQRPWVSTGAPLLRNPYTPITVFINLPEVEDGARLTLTWPIQPFGTPWQGSVARQAERL